MRNEVKEIKRLSFVDNFYLAVIYFGDDSVKLVIRLDQIDSLLKKGYVVKLIEHVKFLLSD